MRRLFATLLTLAAAACGADPSAPLRIVLIGDSITAGSVSGPPGPSFAELLHDDFGSAAEFVVAGCPGANTRSWTRPPDESGCHVSGAFEQLAEGSLPADVVVVLLGTNDALAHYLLPVPPPEYEERLEALLKRVREHGAGEIVLVTPPPLGSRWPERRAQQREQASERLRAYREIVARLCAGETVCGPDLQSLLDPAAHFDGIVHPNAAGHAVIAEALAETLRRLL